MGQEPGERATTTNARVLFFAANPATTPLVRLDEEAREIDRKIQESDYRASLELRTRWAARPDDLLQGLNKDRPTIVHFSGHGTGSAGIVLQDDSGSAVSVPAEAMTLLFKAAKGNVKLVLLNACFSKAQAVAICKEIDFVIGMSDAIRDDAARIFASAFYRAIGFDKSVQDSFNQGIAALALAGIPQVSVPVLMCKPGIRPEEAFLLRPF